MIGRMQDYQSGKPINYLILSIFSFLADSNIILKEFYQILELFIILIVFS